jgi:hypothetical protein
MAQQRVLGFPVAASRSEPANDPIYDADSERADDRERNEVGDEIHAA